MTIWYELPVHRCCSLYSERTDLIRERSRDPYDWFHLDSFATCLYLELQVFVGLVIAFLNSTSLPQLASRLSFGYGALIEIALAVREAQRYAKARTGSSDAELEKDVDPDNQNGE